MLWTLAMLLAILPGLSAPGPAAAGEIRVEVKDFGEYELVTTGQYPAPRTVSGQAHSVANIRLIRQTDTIFAQPGVHFGYRYRIRGELDAENRLLARTVHPPLTNPATGRAATVSELDVALPLDPSNQ